MQNNSPPKEPSRSGPRTSAGRAIVSRNAVTHGIMTPHPGIIEGMESQEEWERHVDGIIESLAPEGALEQELSERIATLFWRLRRVMRYESAVINFHVASTQQDLKPDSYLAKYLTEVPDPSPQTVAVYQEARVLPSAGQVEKITRYETHIHRQLVQTMHELEALQARRKGEQTHLARLDVSSPP